MKCSNVTDQILWTNTPANLNEKQKRFRHACTPEI